ncbi:MAG: hypothetical protein Q8O42_13830 [Acidobacteriota bacterium]|nr:hypothetical protein [Acidobacteriota bacterium]
MSTLPSWIHESEESDAEATLPPEGAGAARLFDGVVFRGMSPDALLPVSDEAGEWQAAALPRSHTCSCTLRPGALVVERALGEGRLAWIGVLGEDIQVEQLYGADGRIRDSVLVLTRRARTTGVSPEVLSASGDGEQELSFLRWSPGTRATYFPPRDPSAPAGHAFMASIGGEKAPADWAKREDAMVAQLVKGNMPDKLLRWVTVNLTYTDKTRTITGSVQVLPDYLAVGSDTDWVYAPLDPVSAQLVADRFDCMLPTARICQAIYSQANPQVAISRDYYLPDALRKKAKVGRAQTSTAAYVEHSDVVQAEMKKAGLAVGDFVAGHKKDVVLARSLHGKSDRIAFHGFYDKGKYPFEPCYENKEHKPSPACNKDLPTLAHERRFADYAQGVRLVHPSMMVDGKAMAVAAVLVDPTLSFLISAEGPIAPPRIPNTVKPTLGILEVSEGDEPAEAFEAIDAAPWVEHDPPGTEAEDGDLVTTETNELATAETTAPASAVAIEPVAALGTARTAAPIATVSPQRQVNEMLDRELILIAQARVLATAFTTRSSATFDELAADTALMARLDVSKDGPLLDRIRPFPNRKIPDRRAQLFTPDDVLQRALAPPRDAAALWPILDLLHHYGVVLRVPNATNPFGRPTVMASITRLTAELTRTRFDAETAQLEQRAAAFKRAVASQGTLHHMVASAPMAREWSAAPAGQVLSIAGPLVSLLSRVRTANQQWRAGTYPRHWWNDFSVDIFIAAALETSGFWSRAAVRAFFAALDTACAAPVAPGPFAWKAIYNDQGLAQEMNTLYGDGRVLSGVDGHGPGPRMHIHLDLRPLTVPFDATTGFWRYGARVVLSPPSATTTPPAMVLSPPPRP